MKILITGGAGTLGSNIAKRFEKENFSYLILDNFETGTSENISEIPSEKIIEGSILDTELLEKVFEEYSPTHILHSAASYKNPDDFEKDAQVNITGSIILARLAHKYSVQKIINFQTALCYGQKPLEQPITLEHPIIPSGSSYAITKTTNEQFLELSGIKYVTFRLANVVGP